MKKLLLLLAATPAFLAGQSIPNPGFETWVSNSESPHTYQTPQGWITGDIIQSSFSNLFGDPAYVSNTVSQVSSAHGGSSAVQMTVAQSNEGDTVAGIIYSVASANTVISSAFNGTPAMGFPYTTRSANLTGYYKLTRMGGDTAGAAICFTKWNTATQMRDTVALVNLFPVLTSASSWTSFTIPVNYLTSEYPDTAFIAFGISSATPHMGTTFTIDDIAFSGTVPAGIDEQHADNSLVSLFPNPFSDQATLDISKLNIDHARLEIYDMLGNKVRVMDDITGDKVVIDREGLPSGVYFYYLMNGNALAAEGKISVQ
ncbi:MAG TPA: T9SS type A sorting domain-containing protein [Bacteroidia bacterium]|nr:T9SS type A sorting domain-containing protein [Bacteroidia bacterium]